MNYDTTELIPEVAQLLQKERNISHAKSAIEALGKIKREDLSEWQWADISINRLLWALENGK